jgi:outer membrane protein TolC
MRRYPLALALAIALLPAAAHAEDLLQTYELARAGDPQLSAAEASRRATREGAVQARAALLPQIDGVRPTGNRVPPARRRRPSLIRQPAIRSGSVVTPIPRAIAAILASTSTRCCSTSGASAASAARAR